MFVVDAHAAVLMKKHGITTIYARDADFRRYPFLTVIDPLQSSSDPRAAPPGVADSHRGGSVLQRLDGRAFCL